MLPPNHNPVDYVIRVLRPQHLTAIMLPKITKKNHRFRPSQGVGVGINIGQHKLNNSKVSYATCSSLKEEFLLKTLKISYAEIFM